MIKKNRRNFLKTAIIALLLWIMLTVLITQTAPDSPFTVGIFFFLAFWALLLPLSIIFANSRRGLVATIGILGTLSLKPLGIFTIFSVGAWWTIVLLIEFWLSIKQSR